MLEAQAVAWPSTVPTVVVIVVGASAAALGVYIRITSRRYGCQTVPKLVMVVVEAEAVVVYIRITSRRYGCQRCQN